MDAYINTKVTKKILDDLNKFNFKNYSIYDFEILFKNIGNIYIFYYNFIDKDYIIKIIMKTLKDKNCELSEDLLKYLKDINFLDLYYIYTTNYYKEKLEKELNDKKIIKKNKI